MKRRRALAIAGTVVATAATAALAIAANIGLLGFDRSTTTSLGGLTARQPIELAAQEVAPITTDTVPPKFVVRYEDIYVPAPRAMTTSSTTVAEEPTPTEVGTEHPEGDDTFEHALEPGDGADD